MEEIIESGNKKENLELLEFQIIIKFLIIQSSTFLLKSDFVKSFQ